MSVLLDVGSKFLMVYEIGNDALDEVGWSVGQSCFRNRFGGYFAGFAR